MRAKILSMFRKGIPLFYHKQKTEQRLNSNILKLNNVQTGQKLQINGIIKIDCYGTLTIGNQCIINSGYQYNPVGMAHTTHFYLIPNAVLDIGNNVGISNSLFYCTIKIEVEDDVLIGGGCQIFDTDFHSIKYADRILNGDDNKQQKPVRIKKGAFIGCNTIILKGVTIGERSVIGAGSVVRCDIPPDEIWAGNPAAFVRKINN